MASKVHQIITDRIIEAIEAGKGLPWQKPWAGRESMPVNHRGIPYRGINTFILNWAQQTNGYKSNFWLTPNQVGKMGGTIRKGEHVQYITFWKVGDKREVTDDEGNVTVKRSFILRYYKVVNLEQTEGVKRTKKMAQAESLQANEDADRGQRNVIDEAEAILASYLAQDDAPSFGEDGGNRAYYIPALDEIHIPERQSFNSDEEFYSTAFHEVGHSTGHKSRCNREGIHTFDHFGSDRYGREELVAEMTSVMLSSEAGIVEQVFDNSVAYLENWKNAIKADPEMLILAAGRAQKAFDYVVGTTFDSDDEE